MAYDTINAQFTGVAATQIECWCGIAFAIPKSLYQYYQRRNEEQPGCFSLHCPMGHTFIPAGKTAAQREADKLRDELTRAKARTDQAEADAKWHRERREMTERRLSAARGQVTKIKNRVKNGVCPCCNRTFQNLMAHMKSQHPEWQPEGVIDAAT